LLRMLLLTDGPNAATEPSPSTRKMTQPMARLPGEGEGGGGRAGAQQQGTNMQQEVSKR
jgi:hypothetical protein